MSCAAGGGSLTLYIAYVLRKRGDRPEIVARLPPRYSISPHARRSTVLGRAGPASSFLRRVQTSTVEVVEITLVKASNGVADALIDPPM